MPTMKMKSGNANINANDDVGVARSASTARDFKTPTRHTTALTSSKENNANNNNGNRPLSSHRDPRRTPLLGRVPFTPTPNPKSANANARIPNSSAARSRKKDINITPAYAYKNAETGLLEIRTVIPPSLSMVANEDDTVTGLDDDTIQRQTKLALYPIALNGGGAGLYRDPREFASDNGNVIANSFSTNHKSASSRRAPLKSHVRFAWPYESKKLQAEQQQWQKLQQQQQSSFCEERDLEAGFLAPNLNIEQNYDEDDDRTTRTRQSIGTLATAMNPWKVWENVHNEMSRLAALRTQRLEDEASHVTLARQRNKATRVSSVYNDDDFDFALVLAPHEAYAFWATHLDFREEAMHLVDDEFEVLDDEDDDQGDDDSTIATATCEGALSSQQRKEKESEERQQSYSNHQMNNHGTPKTPNSGLRRRKNRATPTTSDSNNNRGISSRFSSAKKNNRTPLSTGRSNRSPFRAPRTSERVFSQRKSLFERALDRFSPPNLSSRNLSASLNESDEDQVEDTFATPSSGGDNMKSPYVQRRRWGNTYDGNKLSTPNLTSPPIVSLKKGSASAQKNKTRSGGGSNLFQWRVGGGSSARRVSSRGDFVGSGRRGENQGSSAKKKASGKRSREDDEDMTANKDGDDTFFASPGVPRGIAARVNGLGQFLEALKIGIVVRRHWPNGKSVFVQLLSDDGGDSIQMKFIPDEEADIALKEQAQRYNTRRRKKKARISFGESQPNRKSCGSETTNQSDRLDSSVPLPDYLKAKIDREDDNRKKRGFLNAISNNTLAWKNTLAIESKDIVQVQPASHIDPFSKQGDELGTASLRQSKTQYEKGTTLSIIIPSRIQGKFVQGHATLFGDIDLTDKWCDGGHRSLFHAVDIECATEGEYWMVLKGLVLLHRDASTGRFAAQRAGGFGSYYRHAEVMDANADGNDIQSFHEALPPPKTFIQKMTKKGDAGQAEEMKYTGIAPPSDYFLGFSSPGTQIWGRLRQAGLETQRIYALDTSKVMIKVRCPAERLQDVAEALKLKLKTKDGEYAPFREDMINQFAPTDDGFVSCENDVERVVSLFRSSERQKIIDFIIGSRIRDSGAELGPSTQLGKQIQRRVPLHSHMRLEALYRGWVPFWYTSNWTDRDGKSLQVGGTKSSSNLILSSASKEEAITDSIGSTSFNKDHVPHFLYRFFIGCFYLPLDSIEEYYGEKVAFYFAWLQHCSFHLLYLSVIGLIVFICQVTSGNWDHPLRPWYSIVVMIWSFVVMVTWSRRSNTLAHQWGTLDYQEEEVPRPEFKGTEFRVDPITNTYQPYYPPWRRWLKMCISIPLTVGFTLLTLFGILILYGNRDIMLANYFASGSDATFQPSFSTDAIGGTAPILSVELNAEHLQDPSFWFIIVGFPTVLGLTLPLLNFVLRRLSLWLNDLENHRTEAEYRTHFIIKVFAFRFVCYFAALYYYSFIGVGTTDPQATEHGILRVASTLFTYLTISHWWTISLNVFFPMILYRWRVYRERLRLRNELRSLEMTELELGPSNEHEKTADERLELKKELLHRRLLLEHAQVNIWEEMMLPEHDSFTEYLFAVTQFAYVTCFSVVLPITPLIVLINHLLNMRLDAFKICRGRRRPLAKKTGGIGVWNHVLHIVTVLAILTNCSLMALTSFQFAWLKDQIGTLGVFALAIGWEHLMLLLKYILQLTISVMPTSLQNEIRKKKYDQERKRYLTLRAKKDRRSGSVGLAGEKIPLKHSDSEEENGDESEKKDSSSFHSSPCPPIRESLAETYSRSSAEKSTEDDSATYRTRKDNTIFVEKPAKRGVVNVRSTKIHSPLQEQNISSHRRGSRQKFTVGRSQNSQPISKAVDTMSTTRTTKYEENNHPNFEEAISKLPRQPPSTSRSTLRSREYNMNDASAKKLPPSNNLQRSTAQQSNTRLDNSSRREAGMARSNHQQQHQQQHEEIISPSSSLSTVPGMPTPCQLHLDSDDDTLYTVEDGYNPTGYYHGATAPPLSPPNNNNKNDYGAASRSTMSSGSAYYDGRFSEEDALNDDAVNDDDNGVEAKWGVHHILQYARSERSMSLSERTKAR